MIYNKNMKCRKRESKMKAYERFLKYVSVWTTSDENSETVPSADRELVLAKLLVEEMKELGIVDARAAENADIVPDVAPIRGGTDGARLSFKGLPCPNLGTGAYNVRQINRLQCFICLLATYFLSIFCKS